MKQYLGLCRHILKNGEWSDTRTGVRTLGVFGAMCQYDLRMGFPILTTKKVLFDTVLAELLWFIRGGHNIHDADAPKRIWDDWADRDGELGRIYGVQWRKWRGYTFDGDYPHYTKTHHYDQLTTAIEGVKKMPNSRRNIVSAWNVAELEQGEVGFPPCHVMFQLRVVEQRLTSDYDEITIPRLDMAMYQRSADMCLGVPFNISSYALLLALIANECEIEAGILTHFLADAHIYENHIEKLEQQLVRPVYDLPQLALSVPRGFSVVDVRAEHIALINYQHHPFITYPVAV